MEKEFERKTNLGIKILINCRNEWYRYFPYLDGAFASLELKAGRHRIFTDGERILFDPNFVLKKYVENPAEMKRGYLHILLHCLSLHLFSVHPGIKKDLWNLACDIVVEQIITLTMKTEHIEILKGTTNGVQEECLAYLGEKTYSPEQIYGMLLNGEFLYSAEEMKEAFQFDDHDEWEHIGKGEQKLSLRKKWEHVKSYTSQNKKNGQNRRGSQKGDDQEVFTNLQAGRYDYWKFLRKFAMPREEMELDIESFDYVFYHYGLTHYENMPLIEPLEYKEVNRLEELVIAIDTSGSCSREMVQKFLDETYRIFSQKENFFRKMNVHILQCDCYLQNAAVIHSEEEWKEYSKNVVIQGRAGTDFRPVFRYVAEKREKKEIKNLKALIYFTDGDGIFPEKTDYETAFVFVKKNDHIERIPGWIRKLLIYQ